MSASTPAANAGDDLPTLPSRHTGLLKAAVMGISICQFLDLTIANVALPHMQSSLSASMESISWVLTSFIIAGVLVLPLTGWLSDRFGSRNLFLGASILFVLSSMACGSATSLTQMVIFRSAQGIASAFLGPMAQTIMLDVSRPSKQAQAMTMWGLVIMIGPISGPFLGGFLTETLNWRWVFYVNLPIGIPALILLWWLLPSRPVVRRKLDLFGAVWLACGLGSLQLMLDRGQHKDWFQSPEIVAELIIALSALWIFYVHSRTVTHRLFSKALMRDPHLLVGMAFMVILGIANVALSAVLPNMFQNIYGYDVMDTGLLMAPRGAGVFMSMLLANFLMGKVDNRILISAGFLISAYSLWMMSGWSLDMGREPIILAGFVQGLGMGILFVPVNTTAFATLAPHFRTDGATLMTLSRNIGSSFGISVIVTLLARNIQISHSDIASNVTSFSLPAIDLGATTSAMGPIGAGALAAVDGEVNRQAAMIAYVDNFYMLFWLLLSFVPVIWLMKKPASIARSR